MKYGEFFNVLQYIGKDPSRLIFEDELTGVYNRRFLHNYFQYKVSGDSLKENPLSLIMVDVDHLKKINDTYGHHFGDKALIWITGFLKEVAGDENLPIRYAGDEFLILLPHGDNREALQVGKRLLQRVNEESLRLDEIDVTLDITLSIGVASAPDDAQSGITLTHQADIALYYAKKTGRNQLANAREINPQDVFDKTALHQLQEVRIAGRRSQLKQVAESFRKFSTGQSQFMIVEGAAGMGKSAFLETIRLNLPPAKTIGHVKVNGISQEMFCPYSMITTILVDLLNQRQDKGADIFDSLSLKEIAYLTHLLPQLGGAQGVDLGGDEREQREGLFDTLINFIPKIADFRPLVLLIDDMHFSDEATLVLLRQLVLRREIPLFICGASAETKQFMEEQVPPLERFYAAYHQELGILKLPLTPLSTNDIADYIRGIFPQVKVPENFEQDLAQISHGNPLFLVEILRKLVLDQKITLVGQQWVIETIGEGYLPKSFEEIASQRIAALDEESRQLFQQASTLGEDVSLSVLTGSSEKMEAKVLECVDQAVAQGLISTDFQLNDETIRFLSKDILDIAYEGIQEDQKQVLHERIGNYQETLYQQALLPSAATLAHHFKRSDNQEKARKYEQLQEAHNSKIFNPTEITYYTTKERRHEVLPPGTPLDPESLAQFPTVIRCLLSAVRSFRLYPQGSKAIATANRQLKEAIDQILAKNEHLTILQIKQAMVINSQRIDVSGFKSIVDAFNTFLKSVELTGITFQRGVSENELNVLLEAFGRIKPKMIDQHFWQRFSTEQHLKHIEIQQVRYTMMVEPDDQTAEREVAEREGRAIIEDISAQLLTAGRELNRTDVDQVSAIIRSLLSAARSIKIYPMESKTIANAIEQLMQALRPFLTRKKVLLLAHAGNSLLVNSVRVDISDFKVLADTFLAFLDSIMLSSVTFLENVSTQELHTFIGVLEQLPVGGLDGEFWTRFAKEQNFTTILFNQIFYETRVSPISIGSSEAQSADEIWKTKVRVSEAEELSDVLSKLVPSRISDLLLEGEEKQVQQMINRLFKGFHNLPPTIRKKIIDACRSVSNDMTLSLQHHFSKLAAHELRDALSREEDPLILVEIATLLHRMAFNLIQFAEHSLASQILLHLHRRHRQLEEEEKKQSQVLAKILDRRLEPKTQKLIVEDLKSDEPARQRTAAQLLGSLGQVTAPLLIDTIKKVENFRTRHIAAGLLAEMGSKTAELMKRELIRDGTAEERRRILEVIDTVTSNVKTELAYVLVDENPPVRRAAFQLAERLNDNEVIKLLLSLADSQDVSVVVEAMECLGKMEPAVAVEILSSVLRSTKESEHLVAACQALGHIADPSSIKPLAKMLGPRGLLSFRKRPHTKIRVAAAYALSNIDHPAAVAVFERLVNDSDPQIRDIARTRVGTKTAPSRNKTMNA
jgi:diguanylate cyclase (GGDEF)-like protein